MINMTPTQMVQFILDHPENKGHSIEVECPEDYHDLQFGRGSNLLCAEQVIEETAGIDWRKEWQVELLPWKVPAWPDAVAEMDAATLYDGDTKVAVWDREDVDETAEFLDNTVTKEVTVSFPPSSVSLTADGYRPSAEMIKKVSTDVETEYGKVSRCLYDNWKLTITFPEGFPEIVGTPKLGGAPANTNTKKVFTWRTQSKQRLSTQTELKVTIVISK